MGAKWRTTRFGGAVRIARASATPPVTAEFASRALCRRWARLRHRPIIRPSPVCDVLERTDDRMIDRSRSLRFSIRSEHGGSPQVSGKLLIGSLGMMGCEPANPTRPG